MEWLVGGNAFRSSKNNARLLKTVSTHQGGGNSLDYFGDSPSPSPTRLTGLL